LKEYNDAGRRGGVLLAAERDTLRTREAARVFEEKPLRKIKGALKKKRGGRSRIQGFGKISVK